MIRPLRDLLVIRPEKTPGKVGLLHLPDMGSSSNKSGCICKVVAAGPKTVLAKVGDRILVQAYGSHPAGDEVMCDGETLTMIRERDIDGVFNE
jgi:co-chaperonin GroES (HSP10)